MSQTMAYDRKDDGSLVITLNEVNDGEKTVIETLTLNCLDLPDDIQTKAMVYGVSKVCAERTSDITPGQDKLEGIQEVYDALLEGNWERERKKGGGPTVRIEVEALAKLRGITVKQAQSLLKKYDKEKQEQIFAHDSVQEIVKEMQAADAPDDMDFDDMLGAA